MNQPIKILLFVLVIGLAIWGILSNREKSDAEDGADIIVWTKDKCILRSKKNFSSWKVDATGKDVPSSGNHGRISEKYFGGKPGMAGKVGGFFKGVDTLATMDAARYYEKEMIAYVNSKHSYDWWQVNIGELLCKENA